MCELVYLCRSDFQKIVGNIGNYLKMNYGGEFDANYTNNPTAAARELARKQGRRGTVNDTLVDHTKLKIISGIDATIIEEKSSGESSRNTQLQPVSIPSQASRVELVSSNGDDGAQDDYIEDSSANVAQTNENNEYDWLDADEDCSDERPELRSLPQSLLLKRQFWT